MTTPFSMKEYNGWENQFTWMMHLHLTNTREFMDAATGVVRGEKESLRGWVTRILDTWFTNGGRPRPDLDDTGDEPRLLAWNILGLTLALVEYDDLMALFYPHLRETPPKEVGNPFTDRLYHQLTVNSFLRNHMLDVFGTAFKNLEKGDGRIRFYAGSDAVKEAFETDLEEWLERRPIRYAPLYLDLVVLALDMVAWEHVESAFREEEEHV